MGRENTEIQEIFRAKSIPQNAPISFSSDFPLGGGWVRLMLRLNHTVTIGTGSTPIALGEHAILKALSFRTDKGEMPFNNVPGIGLYRVNQIENGTLNVKDDIAAASATYRTDYDLWFIDPRAIRPYDTILDTSRYRSVELTITLGGVADFFGTVGTSSNVSTADLYVERVKGVLPDGAKPKFMKQLSNLPPVNPASFTSVDIERAQDLSLKRIFIGTHNSATAGVPFSGTAAANVEQEFSLETDRDIPFRSLQVDVINRKNKTDYMMEAVVTGGYVLDLLGDRSNRSALFTGDLARLQLKMINDTLSTSQVSVVTESLRDLQA